MTLLFLGAVEGQPIEKIQGFLEHAVSILELGPFMLDVDYRGVLGPDNADVVFFRKDYWSFKRLAEFRAQLLKDTNIKTAYDSTTQFPEWQPHLTLGYPPTPAREDTRDYPGVRWVDFDRIALWTGDFEGPEFRLSYKCNLEEVAMSDEAGRGRRFLVHHGVKGMKWGQRRLGRTAQPVTTKAVIRKHGQTKLKAAGGGSHPPTPDAIKTAMATQKLKVSGPHALSNQELRDVAERLNLEQQVTRLAAGQRTRGQKAVDSLLADPGRTLDQVGTAAKAGKELVDLARSG